MVNARTSLEAHLASHHCAGRRRGHVILHVGSGTMAVVAKGGSVHRLRSAPCVEAIALDGCGTVAFRALFCALRHSTSPSPGPPAPVCTAACRFVDNAEYRQSLFQQLKAESCGAPACSWHVCMRGSNMRTLGVWGR